MPNGGSCRNGALNEEEIRRRVSELGEWFHNIDLNGVQTAPGHFLGNYPAAKWYRFRHEIPEDLRGKTVLDIGCNAGFYSIEMKRRGADLVVGIDRDEDYLAQARFAAEICGAEIEFRQLSVYDIATLDMSFDLVLFMGLFYHLRHPLLALDLIRENVVGDLFVFQSMIRGEEDDGVFSQDYPFTETGIFLHPNFPRLHFIENCYSGDPTNWWIPNRSCVEALLRSSGFTIVKHPEPEVYICRMSEIPSVDGAVYPKARRKQGD